MIRLAIRLFGEKDEKIQYINRDGAYLLTMNKDHQYPMVENEDGAFLIGGGIEFSETPEEALIREVGEEIGCHVTNVCFVCDNISYYKLDDKDYCSHNYFYYANILDKYKESEEQNKEVWKPYESAIENLTLEHQRWGITFFYEHFVSHIMHIHDIYDSLLFINGIRYKDYDILKKVPKSDLHNHAPFGASPEVFYKETGKQVETEFHRFEDMEAMSNWCDKNVSREFDSKEGYLKRIECAFIQASNDGVTKLSLNFAVCAMKYFNDALDMIQSIQNLRLKYYMDGIFYPELCLDRNKLSAKYIEEYKMLLDTNYFHSIDLTGDESLPIDEFIPLYKMAKEKGLVLKAHIGEFSDANAIIETIKLLNLDQIQHGISLITSKECLDYVKKN